MPLFRRSDGDLIRDVAPVRAMLPLLLRRRNESLVYHEARYDLTRTRPWLRAFNRAHRDSAATLFHVFLWACGHTLHVRPGMNRFVSGGRHYQRRGAWVSFAAKKTFERDAPLVPVKLEFPVADEPFPAAVDRITSSIVGGRGEADRPIDREMRLGTRLPFFVLRGATAVLRRLDRWNLLPARMIVNDPLFTSVFVANLGSVGLDDSYHHLYEHGTCSLFAALGTQRKTPVVDRRGQAEIKDTLQVRWTLDERVTDAFYCASSLAVVRQVVEDPERFLGHPSSSDAG